MKIDTKKYINILLVAGGIVGFDQWTKWLVKQNIPLNTSFLPDWLEWLAPYARFTHIENSGASFGMFQNGNTVFVILALLIVGGMLFYVSKMETTSRLMIIAVGVYMGGAIGNLIDRLTIGKVTDFVSVGSFYIFNVADASINIAVVLLLIAMWQEEKIKTDEVLAE